MDFIYKCIDCNKEYQIGPELMVCPECSKTQPEEQPLVGILEVKLSGEADKNFDVHDLLPIEREYFPSIPVGKTRMWEPTNLRKELDLPKLYFKDDSSNPTGSFKDRASYLVAATAKKFGIKEIVLASTGNAGSSMAGVGAAAGLNITIFLPKNAPPAKMIQACQYGAKVIMVDGNYDLAYDFSMKYSKINGGMNRNTAYNPMTIEGKKTVSLEIFQDLGGVAPDYVFVSTGDGCILAGVYKGFNDLLELGLIKKIPTIYSVQAENSDALFRAMKNGEFKNIPTATVADSICVDVPRNGFHALKLLKKHKGKCVTVTDEEILSAQKKLSETTGLFTEPAGSAAFAGVLKYQDELHAEGKIVVLTTGSGLKDTASAQKIIDNPIGPIQNINELK